MSQPSIVLLVPYFGRWPEWFEFFLHSCRFNSDIQWLFYTDCGIPKNAPNNVSFTMVSFADYKNLVSQRLGINFQPDSPYKLCDLKPALGYIHEYDIQDYDYWGFSDIDLVYGNLREYFTAERLAKYDLLSTHNRRISGHLCLMRNTEKMRSAFKLIKNWQQRLADNEHYALDEGAFSRIFIRHKNLPKPLFHLLAKFNPWRRKSEFSEAFSTPNAGVAWEDGSYNFPSAWCWSNGRIYNDLVNDKVYPYFHFFKWKTLWKSDFLTEAKKISINDDLSFKITSSGIKVNE